MDDRKGIRPVKILHQQSPAVFFLGKPMEVELSLEKYAPLIVKSQKLSQLHSFYTYYV